MKPPFGLNHERSETPRLDQRIQRGVVVSWRRRRHLLKAAVLLAIVSVRLRLTGLARTRSWLDRGVTSQSNGEAPCGTTKTLTAHEMAYVVRLVARLVPDATCLRKALVLRRLLADVRVPSTVYLGARRDPTGTGYDFHAWVEVDGEVISEPKATIAPYTVLLEDP